MIRWRSLQEILKRIKFENASEYSVKDEIKVDISQQAYSADATIFQRAVSVCNQEIRPVKRTYGLWF